MYGSDGTLQPTTQLAGGRGRGEAVREKWRGRAGAPQLPQSLLHWTGVTGCWAVSLRDWCRDGAKPRSRKERAGLQFPLRAVWNKAQRALVPTSSTPLFREAQTSILPAQHPCRQSSLPPCFPLSSLRENS